MVAVAPGSGASGAEPTGPAPAAAAPAGTGRGISSGHVRADLQMNRAGTDAMVSTSHVLLDAADLTDSSGPQWTWREGRLLRAEVGQPLLEVLTLLAPAMMTVTGLPALADHAEVVDLLCERLPRLSLIIDDMEFDTAVPLDRTLVRLSVMLTQQTNARDRAVGQRSQLPRRDRGLGYKPQ